MPLRDAHNRTIRDLRIFARAVAHHLQLSEGARKDPQLGESARQDGG
jgi:hypothetical protein